MTTAVLTVGPGHDISTVARMMAERDVGAAIVIDPDAAGPGIITERDIMRAFAAAGPGQIASETVARHSTERAVYAAPDWSLERAAEAMVAGGFRHLIVVEHGAVVGVLSMRDIVRCWVTDGATSEVEVRQAAG